MKRSLTFRTFLCLAAVAAAPALASAQLEYDGEPPSAYRDLPGAVTTVTMPGVDVEALLAEDAAQEGKGPFRFGEQIPVDLGFDAGTWEDLGAGDRVWRLRIASPGAYSLSLIFSEWDLPAGAELYAYNDDRSWTFGQFNVNNNKPNGQMAIRPLEGQALTLEYFVPGYVDDPGALRVGTVVHDYKNVNKMFAQEFGPDGSCEIDVACPQGIGWEQQVRSVARILNGGILCTGSLVNNTANDGTQLFMSANHCGGMNNAIFYFKYERPNCGSGSPPNFTIQGSSLLATSGAFDFRLLRINNAIPASYEPFYAGWDRTGITPGSTTTIHHPGGQPKKISFDNNSPQKSGSQWRIVQWDLGVTQGGSSGCPLYTPQGRFIGQLCCGAAFCGFPFDDFYGRLDSQWAQVAAHLDPLGTGQTTIDGLDPFASPPVLSGISPSTVTAFGPGQVTLTGVGFSGSNAVKVGATTLTQPGGFTVVDDNTITFGAPAPTSLGSVAVSVEKPAGSSGSLNLNYVATDPPVLTATGVTVTGLTAAYNFGAQPNDLWFLFVSANDNSTVNVGGFDILANSLFLTSGTLSAVGTGNFGIIVPPGLSGGIVYSQLALLDDVTFGWIDVSNIAATSVLL